MRTDTIRAAAVQISPDLSSCAGTLDRSLNAIRDAAGKGADFIVFPETFLPYYPYFSFVLPPVQQGKPHLELYAEAVAVPSPVTDALADAARKSNAVIVMGVNERDHGSLYNTQLIFDATGEIVLKRRKITPTYHERMVWGQGDGAGLKVVDTKVGRVGALACWEHYNPLARYALMAQHEEIHAAHFPGSLVGPIFGEQIEVTMRHHALEAACFVVNATGWLTEEQIASIHPDPALQKGLRDGCMTCIISPEGRHLADPLTDGEGILIADLDMKLITKRKRMMDSVGHYARPELLHLVHDNSPKKPLFTPETQSEQPPANRLADPEPASGPSAAPMEKELQIV